MKNIKNALTLAIMAIMMLGSFNAEAQGETKEEFNNYDFSISDSNLDGDKTKLFCVTTSCCSFLFFTVEIWSETTCHYVSAEKIGGKSYSYSFSFETNEKNLKSLGVKDDILLAGLTSKDGNPLFLPKGQYKVYNNKIYFNPIELSKSSLKAKKYCYIREVKGHLFGHDYSYNINICISFGRNSAVISLKPELTKEEILKMNNQIEFSEDIIINEKGIDYIFKAGKHYLNDNGYVYVQGIKVK